MHPRAWLIPLTLAWTTPAAAGCPVALSGSATDITASLAEQWRAGFAATYPAIPVAIDAPAGPPLSEHNPGLAQFLTGKRDFALVSRDLSAADEARYRQTYHATPRRIPVAGGSAKAFGLLDPVVFVVNDANPLRAVTLDQLKTLLRADSAPAWESLGVPIWHGRAVHLIGGQGRTSSESARARVVRDVVLRGKAFRAPFATGTEADVPARVAADPLAIGFTGLGHVVAGAHILAIRIGGQAVPPDSTSLASAAYPLARTINLYAAPGPQSAALQQWIAYLRGPQGQRLVAMSPFLPLAAKYRPRNVSARSVLRSAACPGPG